MTTGFVGVEHIQVCKSKLFLLSLEVMGEMQKWLQLSSLATASLAVARLPTFILQGLLKAMSWFTYSTNIDWTNQYWAFKSYTTSYKVTAAVAEWQLLMGEGVAVQGATAEAVAPDTTAAAASGCDQRSCVSYLLCSFYICAFVLFLYYWRNCHGEWISGINNGQSVGLSD